MIRVHRQSKRLSSLLWSDRGCVTYCERYFHRPYGFVHGIVISTCIRYIASRLCCWPLSLAHNRSRHVPTEIYPFDWTHNSIGLVLLLLLQYKWEKKKNKTNCLVSEILGNMKLCSFETAIEKQTIWCDCIFLFNTTKFDSIVTFLASIS